jgi:hypothetical protein
MLNLKIVAVKKLQVQNRSTRIKSDYGGSRRIKLNHETGFCLKQILIRFYPRAMILLMASRQCDTLPVTRQQPQQSR